MVAPLGDCKCILRWGPGIVYPWDSLWCSLQRRPPQLLFCSGDEVVEFPSTYSLTVINCLTPSPKAMGPPDHKLNPLKPWVIINLSFVYIISSVCYRKLTDTLGRMLGTCFEAHLIFSLRHWASNHRDQHNKFWPQALLLSQRDHWRWLSRRGCQEGCIWSAKVESC